MANPKNHEILGNFVKKVIEIFFENEKIFFLNLQEIWSPVSMFRGRYHDGREVYQGKTFPFGCERFLLRELLIWSHILDWALVRTDVGW